MSPCPCWTYWPLWLPLEQRSLLQWQAPNQKTFLVTAPAFGALSYPLFLLVKQFTLFALKLRPSDKPLLVPADGCRLAGSFQGAVSQPVPVQ